MYSFVETTSFGTEEAEGFTTVQLIIRPLSSGLGIIVNIFWKLNIPEGSSCNEVKQKLFYIFF